MPARCLTLSILLSAGLILLTKSGYAMQKQIYSGINRIEIACNQNDSFEALLCERLQPKLESTSNLKVSIIAYSANSGQNKLGAMIVTPEVDGDPATRVRLKWENPMPTGSGPQQFFTDWQAVNFSHSKIANINQITTRLSAQFP